MSRRGTLCTPLTPGRRNVHQQCVTLAELTRGDDFGNPADDGRIAAVGPETLEPDDIEGHSFVVAWCACLFVRLSSDRLRLDHSQPGRYAAGPQAQAQDKFTVPHWASSKRKCK